jgi:hypothetical protein
MTQVVLGGKVVRSFAFTVLPEAFPFSNVFSSRMIVWLVEAVAEPLAEDERNDPMLGIHGTSVRSPPTTAKSVRNLRLEGFAGPEDGAAVFVGLSDI